jgi:hypothetical protein
MMMEQKTNKGAKRKEGRGKAEQNGKREARTQTLWPFCG